MSIQPLLSPKHIPEMAPAENRRTFVSCARVGISNWGKMLTSVGVAEEARIIADAQHVHGHMP